MDTFRQPARVARPLLLPALLLSASASPLAATASESMPEGYYELTVEVGMPHLEESLRYATTRESRCLTGRTLASLFPALRHPSLEGCRLDGERREEDMVHYVLVCESGQETKGAARWRLGHGLAVGTLDVRMGGKNMTFYERVTARAAGACAAEKK